MWDYKCNMQVCRYADQNRVPYFLYLKCNSIYKHQSTACLKYWLLTTQNLEYASGVHTSFNKVNMIKGRFDVSIASITLGSRTKESFLVEILLSPLPENKFSSITYTDMSSQ